MSARDRGPHLGGSLDALDPVTAVLAEAASLLETVEQAVAGGGCMHRNGVATGPLVALERFRREQGARLSTETDADVRAALWVAQLCGVSDDALHTVDRDALRAEVAPTSPVWAIAARLLSPGLVYALTVDSEPGARYLDLMLTGHPDTGFRLTLLTDAALTAVEQHDLKRARTLLADLDALGDTGPDVELVRSRCLRLEQLSPGAPAPQFAVPALDPERGVLHLEQFRGRFLLLHFWGTWCGACVEEFAVLRVAHERYAATGLDVLSVSDDDSPHQVRSFLAEQRGAMPWLHAFAGRGQRGRSILDMFEVDSMPALVLIGPDQRILVDDVHRLRGPALLQTLADALPKEG